MILGLGLFRLFVGMVRDFVLSGDAKGFVFRSTIFDITILVVESKALGDLPNFVRLRSFTSFYRLYQLVIDSIFGNVSFVLPLPL